MRLDRQRLRGKRVAILAGDGFEYVELVVPRKALEVAGAVTEIVSLHEGKIRGMNIAEPSRAVRVDCTLEQADPTRYDALLIPGGFIGPDFIRQSGRARAFVSAFDAAGKPIATLCHGPWLLVSAELVNGRTLASWPGIRDDIVHAGGVWRDEPVVIDRNWVTSRSPADLRAFVPAMTDLFAGPGRELPFATLDEEIEALEEGAERVQSTPTGQVRVRAPGTESVVAKVSSPQHDLPPPLTVPDTRRVPKTAALTVLGLVVVVGLGALALRRALA
jgi:protease I